MAKEIARNIYSCYFFCYIVIYETEILVRRKFMVAEIIINSNVKNLNKTFDYNIPYELQDKVKIGSRVFVRFGNIKKLEEGFVVGIKENSEYKVKDIEKVEENDYIGEAEVKLAKWMANRYFCNISDCIKLMLPPGTTTKIVTNRVKEKYANFVSLIKEDYEIEEDINLKKIKSEKHIRVLKFLIDNGEISIQELELFTDTTRSVIKTLEKNGYIEIFEKKVERNPFIHKVYEATHNLTLTDEQKKAYEEVAESIDMFIHTEFLLFGVTGSRKNRSIFAIN